MEHLKVSVICCEKCQERFDNEADFTSHIKTKHSKQWNCDECDFQASTRAILMNHCRLTSGHQPIKQRLGQTGVLECFTCRNEFRSYHDLMEHRKEEHPYHKKCRYFLKGECKFEAKDCWYLQENRPKVATKVVEVNENIQCYICKNIFFSKHDLMEHKQAHHKASSSTKQTIPSPTPNAWAQPLPDRQKEDFYQIPPPAAPNQGALMDLLHKLNQRLQAMVKKKCLKY